MIPTDLLLVAGGAGIGGALRYLANVWIPSADGVLPLSTLTVNAVGAFLLGLLVSTVGRDGSNPGLVLFLGTGILGGFTTFSAFSLETVSLLRDGATVTALGYIALSLALGLAGAGLGLWIGRLGR